MKFLTVLSYYGTDGKLCTFPANGLDSSGPRVLVAEEGVNEITMSWMQSFDLSDTSNSIKVVNGTEENPYYSFRIDQGGSPSGNVITFVLE